MFIWIILKKLKSTNTTFEWHRLWFIVGPVARRWFLEAPRLFGGWEGADLSTICANYYPTLNKSLWAHNQDAIQVRYFNFFLKKNIYYLLTHYAGMWGRDISTHLFLFGSTRHRYFIVIILSFSSFICFGACQFISKKKHKIIN